MALSKSQIDHAKPDGTGKPYRLTDGGGLVLNVLPTGKKTWRFRYQRDGKDAVVTLGHYPALSLLDARAKALDLKRTQTTGDDPALELRRDAERKRTVGSETFEALAVAFMQREKPHWATAHHYRFENRMVRDVFPVIGQMNPREIQPIDVTRAIAPIEGRGAQDTALRVVGMIGQVLRYGVAKGLADRDVTGDLKGGLDRAPATVHRAAVLDRVDLGRMLADLWDWPGDSYGKPVLQLCAYLFQRPGEIRSMRWADVNLDAGLWSHTVSKVGVDHAVPLAGPAVEILRDLHEQTGRFEHVFYSVGARDGFVSAAIPTKILGLIGWCDRHTAHGFRATARTVIAEDLRVDPHLIEQQLSHTVSGPLGRAYNRTQYLPERTDMMRRYADHLDGLRNGG